MEKTVRFPPIKVENNSAEYGVEGRTAQDPAGIMASPAEDLKRREKIDKSLDMLKRMRSTSLSNITSVDDDEDDYRRSVSRLNNSITKKQRALTALGKRESAPVVSWSGGGHGRKLPPLGVDNIPSPSTVAKELSHMRMITTSGGKFNNALERATLSKSMTRKGTLNSSTKSSNLLSSINTNLAWLTRGKGK